VVKHLVTLKLHQWKWKAAVAAVAVS